MIRLTLIVALLFSAFIALPAQDQINVAQYQKLPLIAEKIDFVPYRSTSTVQPDLWVTQNPGSWQGVRLVAWKPPVATVCASRVGDPKSIRTTYVHVLSFPPALRLKLNDLAPKAAEAMRDKAGANTLVLADGRTLQDVTLLYAVPYFIHVCHAGGEEDISLKIVEPNYSALHNLTSDTVYMRHLTLKDGTTLEEARIAAQDPEMTRVSHSGGSLPVALADLPLEAADLVVRNLIEKGRFADEVLSGQARSQKERSRTASSRPTPVPTPTPTPRPDLIRKGPWQYAQLPLNYGKVLHDVTIVGFDEHSIYIEGDSEKSVSLTHLPPEVLADLGDMPYKMLEGFLSKGLVAKERSQVFQAIRNPNADKPFADATGGKLLGYVGPGYIVLSNRYRNYDGAVVGLPKPLGGASEAFILVQDFAHLGNARDRKWWHEYDPRPLPELTVEWPLIFRPCLLDADSVLLDPFEGKYTLFGNEHKIMKRAWRISLPSSEKYAFVETMHGYYFGILSTKSDLIEAGMTWTQLVAHQSMPFVLNKTNQKPLKAGQSIIKISDNDGSTQAAITSFHPEHAQILSTHYRRLIEQGMPGLVMLLQVPQDDGVELVNSRSEPLDFSRQKETFLNRVSLEYVSETDSTVVMKFVVQQRERTVDREKEGTRVVVKEGPWRDSKKEAILELNKDPDGGVRLTDGVRIYEIQPSRVTDPQLITYDVLANSLSKKTR